MANVIMDFLNQNRTAEVYLASAILHKSGPADSKMKATRGLLEKTSSAIKGLDKEDLKGKHLRAVFTNNIASLPIL